MVELEQVRDAFGATVRQVVAGPGGGDPESGSHAVHPGRVRISVGSEDLVWTASHGAAGRVCGSTAPAVPGVVPGLS